MAYTEIYLERPDPGLTPIKRIRGFFTNAVDGLKIYAGSREGVDNVFQLIGGYIQLTCGVDVANRYIELATIPVQFTPSKMVSFGAVRTDPAAAASQNAGLMIGGISSVVDGVYYQPETGLGYINPDEHYICEGLDYWRVIVANIQASDVVEYAFHFKYLNRIWGLKERN